MPAHTTTHAHTLLTGCCNARAHHTTAHVHTLLTGCCNACAHHTTTHVHTLLFRLLQCLRTPHHNARTHIALQAVAMPAHTTPQRTYTHCFTGCCNACAHHTTTHVHTVLTGCCNACAHHTTTHVHTVLNRLLQCLRTPQRTYTHCLQAVAMPAHTTTHVHTLLYRLLQCLRTPQRMHTQCFTGCCNASGRGMAAPLPASSIFHLSGTPHNNQPQTLAGL